MQVIIGNIIALFGSILMVYSGIIKQKKKILLVQTIQISLFVISNIILGGITGAIINAINCFRNILCYKDKFGYKEKIIIALSSTVLSVYFNNIGIIGILPVISTVLYIFLMDMKNIIKFKVLIIVTLILWGIYDIYIRSYTSAIFDFVSVIANVYAIYKLDKKVKG